LQGDEKLAQLYLEKNIFFPFNSKVRKDQKNKSKSSLPLPLQTSSTLQLASSSSPSQSILFSNANNTSSTLLLNSPELLQSQPSQKSDPIICQFQPPALLSDPSTSCIPSTVALQDSNSFLGSLSSPLTSEATKKRKKASPSTAMQPPVKKTRKKRNCEIEMEPPVPSHVAFINLPKKESFEEAKRMFDAITGKHVCFSMSSIFFGIY